MAGLMLGSGARAGAGFTATAASSPSVSGTTATQVAYGTARPTGPATAANGTVIAGAAGALLILWLWYSLPR